MTMRSLSLRWTSLGVAAVALTTLSLLAADKAPDMKKVPAASKKAGVTYAKDIKPLFEKSCVKCHGGEKPKGKYRMESLQDILKGGGEAGEKVVVKGDSAKSVLVHYISDAVEEYEMPPVDKREKFPKLTAEEIGLVRAWIDQGAK